MLLSRKIEVYQIGKQSDIRCLIASSRNTRARIGLLVLLQAVRLLPVIFSARFVQTRIHNDHDLSPPNGAPNSDISGLFIHSSCCCRLCHYVHWQPGYDSHSQGPLILTYLYKRQPVTLQHGKVSIPSKAGID